MSDPAVDLSLPIKPVGPSRPPLMPPRLATVTRAEGDEIDHETSRPDTNARLGTSSYQSERRSMIVGGQVSLTGEISFCDRLVVAGNVEASLHEARELEIARDGVFKGNATVRTAEIRGRFEGDLVVRGRLVMRSTGRFSGSLTYNELEIEPGAELSGILMLAKKNGTDWLPPAFAPIPQSGISQD